MGKEASILVRILGDADNAKKATDDTESAFSKMGDKLGDIALAIGAAFAAAGLAAVVGLEKLGASFDTANDKIAVGTGATGEALAGLKDSFKNVVSNVPTDFGSASTAIANINTALGLTGKPLEALSTQFLNLARITDTDVKTNIKSVTGAFNLWGVSADQQGLKLDELFQISQKTGVSVSDLGQQMADGGVQFQQAGLSFEQAGALLGTLAKNGLSVSDVLPALSKSMAKAAKDGVPASDAFRSIFDQIKTAPDDLTASGLAFDAFGAKAGPKFAALIRTGALSYEDLAASIGAGGNTINDTAKATDDWREKLQLLMNRVMVKLEPIATAVFQKVGEVIAAVSPYLEEFGTWLGEKIPQVVAALKAKFDEWGPTLIAVFAGVRDALVSAFSWLMDNKEVLIGAAVGIGAVLVAMFASWAAGAAAAAAATLAAAAPFIAIGVAVAAAVAGFIYAYNHFETFKEVVDAVVKFMTDVVGPGIKAAFDGIVTAATAVVGWFQDHWQTISTVVETVFNIVKTIITTYVDVWTTIIKGAVAAIQFIWDNFGTYIVAAITTAWNLIKGVVQGAIDVIVGIFDLFKDLFTGKWGKLWGDVKDILFGFWEQIKAVVQAAIDGLVLILGVAWTTIKLAAATAWDLIKSAITVPIEAAKAAIDLIWTAIKSAASGVWDGIKTAASTAWDAIKLAITAPIEAARDIISGIWDTIVSTVTGLPSRIASATSGMWDGIKDAFRGAINTIIGWWNGISFTLPSQSIYNPFGADFKIGGWTISTPDIPKLHMGGVVPGTINEESLWMLKAGETVRTRDQEAALGGFDGPLTLIIEGQPFTAMIQRNNRELAGALNAGQRR